MGEARRCQLCLIILKTQPQTSRFVPFCYITIASQPLRGYEPKSEQRCHLQRLFDLTKRLVLSATGRRDDMCRCRLRFPAGHQQRRPTTINDWRSMELSWRGGKFELDTWSAVVCAIACVSTTGLCQVAIAVRSAWLGAVNAGIVVFIVS